MRMFIDGLLTGLGTGTGLFLVAAVVLWMWHLYSDGQGG